MAGEGGGIDLCRAAGDHQLGVRPGAAGLADRLTDLAHGLIGHCAGVEDNCVGQAVRLGLRQRLGRSRARSAGSRR